MKYIDKNKNVVRGTAIIDQLLSDNWLDDTYTNIDYDNGLNNKRKPYRNDLINELLVNQAHLCCYCMVEISLVDTTLEHIIPHKVALEDFESYLLAEELYNHVIHKKQFDKTTRLIPPDKYPHDIAYHNLIASCDANAHCNHFRGNKYVKPFVFDRNIENKVEYDAGGNVHSEYEEDFVRLGLIKSKSPLKTIRIIWFNIAQQVNSLEEVKEATINDVINDLIEKIDDISIVENFTGNTPYRSQVMKYRYFFHYFKQIMPL